ncbi:MAG: hypothetical protein WBM68_11775, partial [Woeseia sp.]
MSDKNSISIAVLSRSQEDVERVNTTLRSAGYAAHCSWIADPQQFDDALGQEALELIILFAENFADNVRQVVKHKHTFYPELPVIAVQSIVDEAAIQDAMRFGARDLVSSNLQSRWLSVFERELRAMRLERALNVT